tara:strand:- start:326 stop:559 length:234 start_codon:yes stop_codon:yes gene_type:complete
MNRVFKSDAEIDLNRCANALEKLVEIAIEKRRHEIRVYKKGLEKIEEEKAAKKTNPCPERGLATKTKSKPKAKEVKK